MALIDPETPVKPAPAGPPKELLASGSFLLKRLGFLLKERAMEAFESTGLSPYHHAVLALLEEDPRETQAMIADALGYDRSHLVGMLDELEERGLIERKRDPNDRRRHLVSLTPEGKRALARLRTIVKQMEDDFFAPLDDAQRETLYALLLELASHHDVRYSMKGLAKPR
jgi:MarR family transcriptional regulator, lower aerobic nicotinate degradation pathway regulator